MTTTEEQCPRVQEYENATVQTEMKPGREKGSIKESLAVREDCKKRAGLRLSPVGRLSTTTSGKLKSIKPSSSSSPLNRPAPQETRAARVSGAVGTAAQGGCGVSFSGDIQDPPGQGPVRPTVGDPASAGGLDKLTHRGPLQPLPCWDSVIL